MEPKVDGDRLWSTLMEMGEIGKKCEGVNRLALNDADKEGRDLFVGYLKDENPKSLSWKKGAE